MISAATQPQDDAVLVGGPHRAVALQEGSAGALLAGKTEGAVAEALDEPFEADRRLDQLAVQLARDAIDDGARHHRLADRRIVAPVFALGEEIGDRGRQEMVRVHQAADGVTMPWRSASVSLAKATSNLSRMAIRLAIA